MSKLVAIPIISPTSTPTAKHATNVIAI
jgi:hypothetical protein